MINKKNLWFLTLFSLILVLSVYYITMPSELLLTNNSTEKVSEEKEVVNVEESDVIAALRVTVDEQLSEELDTLKLILMDSKSTKDQKNEAFDKMKGLNENKSLEQDIEKQIEDNFKLDSFVKIDDNQIQVVVNGSEHDTTLANNIIRKVQENFENQKYITVQFKNK